MPSPAGRTRRWRDANRRTAPRQRRPVAVAGAVRATSSRLGIWTRRTHARRGQAQRPHERQPETPFGASTTARARRSRRRACASGAACGRSRLVERLSTIRRAGIRDGRRRDDAIRRAGDHGAAPRGCVGLDTGQSRRTGRIDFRCRGALRSGSATSARRQTSDRPARQGDQVRPGFSSATVDTTAGRRTKRVRVTALLRVGSAHRRWRIVATDSPGHRAAPSRRQERAPGTTCSPGLSSAEWPCRLS